MYRLKDKKQIIYNYFSYIKLKACDFETEK